MGRQPSIEHAPHLLGEESPLGIPSISSNKDAKNPGSRWKFHVKDPSKAVTEKAPMARTQAPSVDDMPCLLGQECPLVEQMRRNRRTYAEKDEAENAPTPLTEKALQDHMARMQAPSVDDKPRLLGQECPLVEQMRRIRRTYAEKDEAENAPTSSTEKAPQDPEPGMTPSRERAPRDRRAGIPRGIYKSGLRWGGW